MLKKFSKKKKQSNCICFLKLLVFFSLYNLKAHKILFDSGQLTPPPSQKKYQEKIMTQSLINTLKKLLNLPAQRGWCLDLDFFFKTSLDLLVWKRKFMFFFYQLLLLLLFLVASHVRPSLFSSISCYPAVLVVDICLE